MGECWCLFFWFIFTVALASGRRTGPLFQRGWATEAPPQNEASWVELQRQLRKSTARQRITSLAPPSHPHVSCVCVQGKKSSRGRKRERSSKVGPQSQQKKMHLSENSNNPPTTFQPVYPLPWMMQPGTAAGLLQWAPVPSQSQHLWVPVQTQPACHQLGYFSYGYWDSYWDWDQIVAGAIVCWPFSLLPVWTSTVPVPETLRLPDPLHLRL